MIGVTISLIGLVIISAYLYSKYRHRYWSSRGILTPPAVVFMGHLHKMFGIDFSDWLEEEVYNKLCRSGFCGLYEGFSPVLMVGDPELVKSVLIKDFDHFTDRRVMNLPNKTDKVVNDMVSNVNGDHWKSLRAILTPTFTSGKLKNMFDLICQKADEVVSYSLEEATRKPTVNVKDNFSRFVIDTIATCAFGFESNSIKDEDSIFPKRAALFFDTNSFGAIVKTMIMMSCPSLFKALGLALLPKEVLFFNDITAQVIAARRTGEKRGDFLDLLLEAQSASVDGNKFQMDDDCIVAQSVLFIVAGNDTTSSSLAFSSYLLAKHPEEQQRLRQELREIVEKHGGITYQGIMEAKFIDACLMESLRLFPSIALTERICVKPYQIPGTNIVLNPGQLVQIPILSIQMDEQYWPEPKAFKPDRFMAENKENIRNYTFMPFGLGPRNCIAMRFALMEMKIALAKLVLAAEFSFPQDQEPLKVSYQGGMIKSEGGIQLLLKPIQD